MRQILGCALLVIIGVCCFAYQRWVQGFKTHRQMGFGAIHAPTLYVAYPWAYHWFSYALLGVWFTAFRLCGFGNWTALVPIITWFVAGLAGDIKAFTEYRARLRIMLDDPDSTIDKAYLERELKLSNAQLLERLRKSLT